MAEPKTKATTASVPAFIKKQDADRQADCAELVKLMKSVTRANPVMWGDAIVGFSTYAIEYADGRVADWPLIAFSPRKTSLVLYIPGLRHMAAQVKKVGKTKTAGGCLHIKRMADVDATALKTLMVDAVKAKKARGK